MAKTNADETKDIDSMFPQVAAVTVNKTRFEKQQVPAFKSNEDFWGKSLENLPPFTINPFVPNAPFVYPLKKSEYRKVF